MMNNKPTLTKDLLNDYDLTTFDFEKDYKIVMEQIMQIGYIEDWKAMLQFYPIDQIMDTIECSIVLTNREKDFAYLFLQSNLLLPDPMEN